MRSSGFGAGAKERMRDRKSLTPHRLRDMPAKGEKIAVRTYYVDPRSKEPIGGPPD